MSNFSMTVVNETAATINGVCVVHYCAGSVIALYESSIAPGQAASPVNVWTTSGHNDYYYITFAAPGSAGTTVYQAWCYCNDWEQGTGTP